MAIPPNITRNHLLQAIKKIDEEGIPNDGNSIYYDLSYKNKKYPPKLVISYANLFANGKILGRDEFHGGPDHPSFKFLKQYGFNILRKNGDPVSIKEAQFYPELQNFLEQSETGELKTKHFIKVYKGLQVKVSFGMGVAARIPWISFLMPPNSTSEGIYPVYLNYKELNQLILAYGISETKEPLSNWTLPNDHKKIKDYFNEKGYGKPERYGDSFFFKSYSTANLPSAEIIEKDLEEIIDKYKTTTTSLEDVRNDSHEKRTAENSQQRTYSLTTSLNSNVFVKDAHNAGLQISKFLVDRFISSLCTKPFVILTGLSGSGKTKLAQSFAMWICEEESQYCIVPVGADWTNREPLLGYSNAIEQGEYVKPENGILDLLIAAKKNVNKPFFIVLDEMNLSHVERYFADFLSIMETGENIILFKDADNKNGVPSKVNWPKNVFIIGTVNIDETTYMFSPKVLDRANTIEFRITAEEMETFLQANRKPDLKVLKAKGSNMALDFLRISSNLQFEEPYNSVNSSLLKFFRELKKTGAEFGYRSATEIHQLLHNLKTINTDLKEDEKMDIAIMQKLLPKLHGSRRKLVPILVALGQFCLTTPDEKIEKEVFLNNSFNFYNQELVKYPLTLEKLSRMYNGVIENGFASYAEA